MPRQSSFSTVERNNDRTSSQSLLSQHSYARCCNKENLLPWRPLLWGLRELRTPRARILISVSALTIIFHRKAVCLTEEKSMNSSKLYATANSLKTLNLSHLSALKNWVRKKWGFLLAGMLYRTNSSKRWRSTSKHWICATWNPLPLVNSKASADLNNLSKQWKVTDNFRCKRNRRICP